MASKSDNWFGVNSDCPTNGKKKQQLLLVVGQENSISLPMWWKQWLSIQIYSMVSKKNVYSCCKICFGHPKHDLVKVLELLSVLLKKPLMGAKK